MRLLLDTHIALWALLGDARLPQRASDLILNPDHDVWASVVNIWETAIKHARRKAIGDNAVVSGNRALQLLQESGFSILPVMPAHAAELDHLSPHHGDPFDRMLVAQAQAEPMRLLTHDRGLAAYGQPVLLV